MKNTEFLAASATRLRTAPAKIRFALNTGSNIFNLAIAAIVNLLSAPLALSVWGTEGFAIVVLATALSTYIALVSFGTPQAAEVLGTQETNKNKRRQFFLTAAGISITTAASTTIVLLSFAYLWPAALHKALLLLIPNLTQTLTRPVTYYLCLTAAAVPFAVSSAYLRATQYAFLDNIVSGMAGPSALLLLFVSKSFKIPLTTYLPLLGCIPLLLGSVRTSVLKLLVRSEKEPQEFQTQHTSAFFFWKNETLGPIFATSKNLALISFGGLLVWNADSLLISNILGQEALVSYNVSFRVFSIGFGVIIAVSNSLLPIMGKAYGEHNTAFLRSTYSSVTSLLFFLGGWFWTSSAFFARPFIHAWVGPQGDTGPDTILLLGAYGYFLSSLSLNSSLLLTFNLVRSTPFLVFGEALLKLGLTIVLMPMLGIVGHGIAITLSCTCIPFWLAPFMLKKRTEGTLNNNWPLLFRHLLIGVTPPIIMARAFPPEGPITYLLAVLANFLYYPIVSTMVLKLSIKSQLQGFVRSTKSRVL